MSCSASRFQLGSLQAAGVIADRLGLLGRLDRPGAQLADVGDRQPPSFRVSATRADKRLPFTSPQVEREVGGRIKQATGWPVDLILHDVRRPLPWADGALQYVYTSHLLEHLYPDEGTRLLGECFRILKPGGFGLVLGDVSGVGPEAAALTGVARYTVRAVAAPEEAPCGVLARLNEALLRLGSERFLTAVYATLEPKGDVVSVVICSGGHPPGLILRDDESVEVLDQATGMLLGVFPDPELSDQPVLLRAGDALVFVTDGVLEARDDQGVEYGVDRLAQLLSTCTGRSAAGIARRIERSVLDHRGERADDDLAVVVLRASV